MYIKGSTQVVALNESFSRYWRHSRPLTVKFTLLFLTCPEIFVIIITCVIRLNSSLILLFVSVSKIFYLKLSFIFSSLPPHALKAWSQVRQCVAVVMVMSLRVSSLSLTPQSFQTFSVVVRSLLGPLTQHIRAVRSLSTLTSLSRNALVSGMVMMVSLYHTRSPFTIQWYSETRDIVLWLFLRNWTIQYCNLSKVLCFQL